MFQLSDSAFRKLLIALSIYITSLVASNTLGLKIMPFLLGSHLSVSIFYFPAVFLMTDIVGEVYGKKVAKFFVLGGFISTLLFILYSLISVWAPWSESGLWVRNSYDQVFAVSLRISLASLVAFIIGEYQDVLFFFFLKGRIGGKYFWLRSNLSNLWSQFLDSAIFMLIAFLGIYPFPVLVSIIISWWLYKVLMGFLYTPLSYLGIRLLKDNTRSDENKTN